MARFVLEEQFALRGWEGLPFALWDRHAKRAEFFPKDTFLLLTHCNGIDNIDVEALSPEQGKRLQDLVASGVVRKCEHAAFLRPSQMYHRFPCRYKETAHWSITGRCNYRCKHCLVSAPHAKFGHPSTDQLLGIVDQLAKCGVGSVSLTGGEPLVREDFWQIVDALLKRDIGISMVFSNGRLVNEALLDGFESRGIRPGFQMSYDGVGWHDWLRGFNGAEEAVNRAFGLLQERGYHADAAMCLHRRNAHVLRETVCHLATLGVDSLKVNRIQDLGEWTTQAHGLALTEDESLQIYLDYVPQYFDDGAPLSIMLDGAFGYSKREGRTTFAYERQCGVDPQSESRLACSFLRTSMYIGPDGRVCPCMSMTVQEDDEAFPNLFRTPLHEILGHTPFMERCACTVMQVRNANPQCRACAWVGKCNGGCRASAYNDGGGYYSVDPHTCHFFRAGWYERFAAAAQKGECVMGTEVLTHWSVSTPPSP